MVITRVHSIPNSETFMMPPVNLLLAKYMNGAKIIIDPFARNSTIGTITNDLNPNTKAKYHMKADDFCEMLLKQNIKADMVLFDPPYTRRQMKEMYESIGIEFTNADSQMMTHWKNVKRKLARLLKINGIAISFGYNTNGLGKIGGLEIREIMIINHGAGHYDTLVTVEKKVQGHFF